jgi:hypothetical protein
VVRVELASQFTIRGFNLLVCGRSGDAEKLIIILKLDTHGEITTCLANEEIGLASPSRGA